MEPVIGSGADFTLAIELSGEQGRSLTGGPTKETSAQRPANEWLDRFLRGAAGVWENEFVASILARFGRGQDEEAGQKAIESEHKRPVRGTFEPPPPGIGLTDVAAMALDTMGSAITRYRMAAMPPDVTVTIPGDAAKTMDFHRATELIELGRKLTEEALDKAFPEDVPAATEVAAVE
jgi:NTE family protein